jgi:Ca-activated chloride channel family protein
MFGLLSQPAICSEESPAKGGELKILDSSGQSIGACPLKHTDVNADICGFIGRVSVRQIYHNPLDKKIEAVYVFPLPQDSAVDEMVMTVGERRIRGQIKKYDEARRIYDQAKATGKIASLLDQERPNIFIQSVANIEPGAEITIEISYVETLKYEDGWFEFVFPMVVGPRYMPGQPTQKQGTGWAHDTDQVPDASRISPPVARPEKRAGHDISLTIEIDGGMVVHDLKSTLHEVAIEYWGSTRATVKLANKAEIPNRDFILNYRLATDEISDAFLIHEDERGCFFTLILQPPRRVESRLVVARELIFVLDTSGSMSGYPIEKAKETMAKAIDGMAPYDTFNVITFAGDTRILWDTPRFNTLFNRKEAQDFLSVQKGEGGTEMMTAIYAALESTGSSAAAELPTLPVRVVCFMTDGYVGNDMAIIDAVQENAGTTRVFSFGIGNAVNRFLLDGMAFAGRGEVEYVTLESKVDAAADRFYKRILSPVLTDIEIEWGDLQVEDVYPKRIPDLFIAKPIMIHGRLQGTPNGVIRLHGDTGAGPFERTIHIKPSDRGVKHEALATLWARAKVNDLMHQDLAGMQIDNSSEELRDEIIELGLNYRLMTKFTSFVAVEETIVTAGGDPVTVPVSVDMPEGVSYEGVFGVGGIVSVSRVMGPGCGAFMKVGFMTGRGRNPSGDAQFGPASPAPAGKYRKYVRKSGHEEVELEEVSPASKLAKELQDLAAKVDKEGKGGNLTLGKLHVKNYRVKIKVYLKVDSEKTRDALRELGFVETLNSRSPKQLIGTIDVRKLEDIGKLDAVIRIEPAFRNHDKKD